MEVKVLGATTLAAGLRTFQTPEAVIRERLALAGRVSEQIRQAEPVEAALVVGSTALRRCSPRADLDLVVVTPSPEGGDGFETRAVDGVRVEIERMSACEALAATAGGGWVWELRAGARLGCSVAVFDPDGLGAALAQRASAMTPSPGRVEATLRGVYLVLIDLARGHGDAAHRADALRGCLDNLVLLALLERPRRYQKAKWALADLVHAGEDVLVEAVLAAYGIGSADVAAATDALTGARAVVDRAHARARVPRHEVILALGHAPQLAQASYVSRCLDDAGDLAASGRFVEAQYVAKFAARLAAGMVSPADSEAGLVAALAACDDRVLAGYLALFPDPAEPADWLLEATLAAADARRDAFEEAALR